MTSLPLKSSNPIATMCSGGCSHQRPRLALRFDILIQASGPFEIERVMKMGLEGIPTLLVPTVRKVETIRKALCREHG